MVLLGAFGGEDKMKKKKDEYRSSLTQFSVRLDVKNRLDSLKLEKKQEIIEKYNKKKRMVTNTDVIRFLLDEYYGV